MNRTDLLLDHLWSLAGELGRIRRAVDPDSSLVHAVDRACGHVLSIDAMLRPSAAEIAAMWAPGDETAITEAIRLVDDHDRQRRQRLGLPETCQGRPAEWMTAPLTASEREDWRRAIERERMGGKP